MTAQDEPNDTTISEPSCGLLLNPLRPAPPEHDPGSLAERLVTHAAAADLLTTIRRSATEGSFKPVWVEKSEDVPAAYHAAATSEALSLASRPESTGVLAAYIPMGFMRMGKVRAALSALAEAACGAGFERALGRYAASILRDSDTALPEFSGLPVAATADLVGTLDEDPGRAIAGIYGPYEDEREGAQDAGIRFRVSAARQGPSDEDADVAADEVEPATETGSQAAAPAVGAHGAPLLPPVPPDEAANDAADDGFADGQFAGRVAAYIEAHTRAHLSSVVARALVAYRTRGASAAAEELKVTEAPRKTLGALGRFIHHGYESVALLFDEFGGWDVLPDETRASIAAALTEMRWAISDSGIVVVMSTQGATPELEEQFAGARRVQWDMPGLLEARDPGVAAGGLPLADFFRSATLCEPAVSGDDPVLAEAAEQAAGDLSRFVELAAGVVDDAMERGLVALDPAVLERAQAALAGPAPRPRRKRRRKTTGG